MVFQRGSRTVSLAQLDAASCRHTPFVPRTSSLCASRRLHRAGRRATCISFAKNMEINVVADEGMPGLKQVFSVPDGSKIFTASLNKPLGLTLAEKGGKVVVDTVAEGGNGENNDVRVGDIVQATTARSKNVKQEDAEGASVEARNKQSFLGGLVLLKTEGEDFDTVIAAIQSSKCANCDVTLVLERAE